MRHQLLTSAALAAAAALCVPACSGAPLELAAWTIDVPEGTPVRELEVAPLDARGAQRIGLVEDLVIGGDSADREETLYRARDIVVDDQGRIFVLDAGNHRVQVFDGDGSFLHSFGEEGEGPAEFRGPWTIALSGDRLVVNDPATGRLSVWTLEGEHVADHRHGRAFNPELMRGSAKGTIYASYADTSEDGTPMGVTAEFTQTGEQIARLQRAPIRGLVRIRPGANIPEAYAEGYNDSSIESAIGSRPRFALGRDGSLYLAAADEYQVLAMDPLGMPRWALRTTLTMPPFPVETIDDRVERNSRAASRADFDWDELLPAIAIMQVDGHGHLWVYPAAPDRPRADAAEEDAAPPARPVDVYSREGELLFSGEADPQQWHVSFDDFVYELTSDPETQEQIVVRYRLVEPF